ncbi:MAG TPA: LysR family transcriptional regulator [Firmicutes bacterium]|uniref:selenium metabolism-associated LysR family transcriptional regulator n=1 Tax=Gelria sp. Kuro-4 TaxID=2796927 RepID=UPI0019A874E7|nr:selenium metabolism-associated LysR family transcriptional regulator [Gelria sp. Kuro-4]MDK2926361.1 hypothetical protein [Bacillota bacterium]BCV24700.1 LysR family transcriptional regulator [Gelria sp. Kuro-4]HHV57002.1 LysR family transcriptional regulator [Bacillota bacterium]
MELKQLEMFLEIARQGTFTEAAKTLYISQPTISMQMAALEKELGAKLFERQGRRNALTPAGKMFLRYATDILMLRAKAVKAVSAYSREIAGTVNVWASSVPADYLLPRFLPDFLRQHPRVFINLARSDSQEVWEKVAGYAADLGVVGTLGDGAEIGYVPFLADHIIVVAAPEGKYGRWGPEIGVETLLAEPLVVREVGSGTQHTFEQALAEKGFPAATLHVVARLQSTEAVKAAAAAGLGLGVISELAARRELAAGTLRGFRVKDLNLRRQFYLITHKQKVLSPATEALRCYLIEKAGEEET